MDIARSLLAVPTYLLLILMLFFFGFLSALVTIIIHKYVNEKKGKERNEITGIVFSVVAGFYALILAFVVSQALDDFNDVQHDAGVEGSHIRSIYRQINYYPDTSAVAALDKSFLNYVHLVIENEYPLLAENKKSEETVEAFGKFMQRVENLQPQDPNTQIKAGIIFQQLTELATYRSLRLFAEDDDIPLVLWLTLLTGGLFTIVLASLLVMNDKRYHIMLNTLMGAFLGLVYFIIIILDHPFSGGLRVEPTGYTEVIEMSEAKK